MKKILVILLLFCFSLSFAEVYVVELEFKQTSFTLDVGQHIKNSINKTSINIPVIKEFYDAVTVGQEIASSFKIGSLIFDGDFERGKVVIKSKSIIKDEGNPIVINVQKTRNSQDLYGNTKGMIEQRQRNESKLKLIYINKLYKKRFLHLFPEIIQEDINNARLSSFDFRDVYNKYLPKKYTFGMWLNYIFDSIAFEFKKGFGRL